MLFVAAFLLLGFAFALRIFHFIIAHHLLSRSELTKIGTVSFAMTLLLFIALPSNHFAVWIAVVAPLAITCLTLAWRIRRRSMIFRERFRETLTLLILKMKGGRSFRQSLKEVTAECDPLMRAKLAEISSVVVFSQQSASESNDPFIIEALDQFTRADRQPHAAMKRLQTFREKLKAEDDFRRRSGQVTARIRAQSLVMLGLYVAVFTFMVCKFGWRANSDLIIASSLLFASGAVWIWIGGRKLRWKV